jgi:LPXTG-motif cell wall-anchored protein
MTEALPYALSKKAAVAAVGIVILAAGGWYARRRWLG